MTIKYSFRGSEEEGRRVGGRASLKHREKDRQKSGGLITAIQCVLTEVNNSLLWKHGDVTLDLQRAGEFTSSEKLITLMRKKPGRLLRS